MPLLALSGLENFEKRRRYSRRDRIRHPRDGGIRDLYGSDSRTSGTPIAGGQVCIEDVMIHSLAG